MEYGERKWKEKLERLRTKGSKIRKRGKEGRMSAVRRSSPLREGIEIIAKSNALSHRSPDLTARSSCPPTRCSRRSA